MMSRMRWTDETSEYMREIIPGHTASQIRDLFRERFGIELSDNQIKGFKQKYGIKSSVMGERVYRPGHEAHNKGRPWAEWMSETGAEHARANQFKPGDEPANGRANPVGSERIGKDGYVEVKVSRLSDRPCSNKCWKLKQRVVWEEAHGPIPPGHVVIFLDGDKRNFALDNLACISRAESVRLNQYGLSYYDQESLQVALDIVHLRQSVHDARCPERPCRVCGRMFKPRMPHLRTCPECLERRRA